MSFFFLLKAATQLARQGQQERTQVVCSNKVGRSRLAQRHSRNGPRTYGYWFDVYIRMLFESRNSHTQTYKQTRNRTKHKCIIVDQFRIFSKTLFMLRMWHTIRIYFDFSHVSVIRFGVWFLHFIFMLSMWIINISYCDCSQVSI